MRPWVRACMHANIYACMPVTLYECKTFGMVIFMAPNHIGLIAVMLVIRSRHVLMNKNVLFTHAI